MGQARVTWVEPSVPGSGPPGTPPRGHGPTEATPSRGTRIGEDVTVQDRPRIAVVNLPKLLDLVSETGHEVLTLETHPPLSLIHI